jgi:hypothetical protein
VKYKKAAISAEVGTVTTQAIKSQMLKELKAQKNQTEFTKKERKSLKKVYKQQLVKRSHVYKIAIAWVVYTISVDNSVSNIRISQWTP